MVDIVHRIGIKSPAAQVYEALTSLEGLARWWTEEVLGDGGIGGKIAFCFRSPTGELKGKIDMEVQELAPPKAVRWRCTGGLDEWIGTDIGFDLAEEDGQTILHFGHRNWREATDFTSHCSMKWATFLLSLRDYVDTGKGKPAPHDLKIDNSN